MVANSIKEKVFNGTLWSGGGKVASMAANFVVTLALARTLSPADYGSYFIALTTIMIVTCSGMLGMDQVVVRFVSACIVKNNVSEPRNIITTCFIVVVFGAIFTCLLFLLFAPFFFEKIINMPKLGAYIWPLTVWLLLATLQRQLAESFRGLNDIRMATIFGGVRSSGIMSASLACLGVLTLWIVNKVTLFNVLIVMIASSAIIVFTSCLTLVRLISRMQSKSSIHETQKAANKLTIHIALYEGWPLWLATFINVINNLGSGWLAGGFDSPGHVALFGVAQRFMLLLIAPLVIINSVLPPLVSQLFAQGQMDRLERIIRSVSGFLLIPTLLVFVGLVLMGRPFLSLLVGDYYQGSYLLLIILCAGQIINVATGTWQVVLPMTGAKHEMFSSSLIAIFSQLLSGGLLGYLYGVLGVTIAYCVSMIITNVAGMLFVRKRLGIWTHASISLDSLHEAASWVSMRMLSKIT